MNCLKCGKETSNNQVFCDNCLSVMDSYPVKPDIIVNLPHRTESVAPKKYSHKRAPSPEEQVAALHRLVRRLLAALVVVTLLFGLAAAGLVYTYLNAEDLPTIGRNYTIDTTTQP